MRTTQIDFAAKRSIGLAEIGEAALLLLRAVKRRVPSLYRSPCIAQGPSLLPACASDSRVLIAKPFGRARRSLSSDGLMCGGNLERNFAYCLRAGQRYAALHWHEEKFCSRIPVPAAMRTELKRFNRLTGR